MTKETEKHEEAKGEEKKPDPCKLTAPEPPKVAEPARDCTKCCVCPTVPETQPGCFDEEISTSLKLVAGAERAKKFAEEMTASKDKLKSAEVDYTQVRYDELKDLWVKQDELIAELTGNIHCPVSCWECLLKCRLCTELAGIRNLEDQLNGTGTLTTTVHSFYDEQAWHQRNVTQLQAQFDRITKVLAAWEKPSDTLGDALEKNQKLLEETKKILNTDSAKALFDIFMTLLPRHLAIAPSEPKTKIPDEFIDVCKGCDDGIPNNCCETDTGTLSLRNRLIGPLPRIVKPAAFREILCCLVKKQLKPASDLLAEAQGDLAAVNDKIERTKKSIDDRIAGLEATFTKDLVTPIKCDPYKKPVATQTPAKPLQEPDANAIAPASPAL